MRQTLFSLLFGAFLAFVLVACKRATDVMEYPLPIASPSDPILTSIAMRKNTPTPSLTSTMPPAAMPDVYVTSTLKPSLPATKTNQITPFPTSTSVPSLVPPLPTEKAYERLLDLLQTNGGCELPCWWGIYPGESTIQETRQKVSPLAGIFEFSFLSMESAGSLSIIYPVDDLDFHIYIAYYPFPTGNTVETLYISTQILRYIDKGNGDYEYREVYDSDAYRQLLGNFALSEMLSKLGTPSNIGVRAILPNPPSSQYMSVTLYYPEQGIVALYTMNVEIIDNNVTGCPSQSIVSLWLIPPEAGDNYHEFLSLAGSWESDEFVKPLDEVTSMSSNEFYEIFKESSTMRCIETPIDIWQQP